LRHFRGYRGGSDRAWLLAIVRRTCYTRHGRGRLHRLDAPFDEEQHSPTEPAAPTAEELERRAGRAELSRALDRLPVHLREALVLREVEEMSYKEISTVTRVPIGTVMSRLARARAHLLRLVAPRAAGEDAR
jgi:RNA polymerase sigma-70 factor (ECF subfamily)